MIPNVMHFVFGMTEDFGGKPFSLIHYLSIKSALTLNRPDDAVLWCRFVPTGYWWQKAAALVDVRYAGDVNERYGTPLAVYAHRADIVRLEKLIEYGGIYIDLDVICIKSFEPLLRFDCVWGEEESADLLCNGVILAARNSEFLHLCLEAWREFQPWMWNEISCGSPAQLARQRQELIHVEDRYAFHWPPWREEYAVSMFTESANDWPPAYCRHLWESKTWDYLARLSVRELRETTTNLARLVAPFIVGEVDG
jgi:hypothetical protein